MDACAGKMYRTRDPEASPFFALARDYFDEFERVYPEQFQKQYGYWRPIIRDSIDPARAIVCVFLNTEMNSLKQVHRGISKYLSHWNF